MSGPSDTGKSWATVWLLDTLLRETPKAHGILARKLQTSIYGTVLVTYKRIQELREALGEKPALPYGGEKPEFYSYSNGSKLWVGGMDNPNKMLSGERDFIYCFAGDTIVESPSPIIRAYEREYSGPLITIRTANGNHLTGTPNHPILTDHGWVALGLLKIGSNVISRSLCEKVPAGNPNIQNRPSTIAEVFRALSQSQARGAITERIAGVDMDFHGDGEQSGVNIVTTSGLFGCDGHSSLLQPFHHHQIDGTYLNLPLFESFSSGGQIFLSPRLALAGLGDDSSEPLAPFRIALPSIISRLAASQRGQSSPEQFGFDDTVAGTNGRSNGNHPAFPFHVSLDRVVHVGVTNSLVPLKTQVYNLQTEDNYFVAGNIIAHNCNQAEELKLEDWEILYTRCTGRGAQTKTPMIFGDCNPGAEDHWILKRGTLKLFHSKHRDNPSIYDDDGNFISEDAERRIRDLQSLTGVRRKRLYEGLWVGAEGLFFEEWDEDRHVIKEPFPIPADWPIWGALDYGFAHPTAFGLFTKGTDGVIYLIGEHVQNRWPVAHHCRAIRRLVAQIPALNSSGNIVKGIPFTRIRKIVAGHDVFQERGSADGKTISDQYRDAENPEDDEVTGLREGDKIGFKMEMANTARITGSQELLTRLGNSKMMVSPTLKFFSTCPRTIACMPRMVADPKSPEEYLKVDADAVTGLGGDDEADMVRYGVLADWTGRKGIIKVEKFGI